jgi:hypothetical protein
VTPLDSLKVIFSQQLELPAAAADWLLMLFEATQLFDDVADRDFIKRDDLDSVLWATLVAMPANPFYRAHQTELGTLLANFILKWQASDAAEKRKQHNEVSFVWRAGYYDVVLGAVRLCHGPAVAHDKALQIMKMYGESYEDYLKEFGHG